MFHAQDLLFNAGRVEAGDADVFSDGCEFSVDERLVIGDGLLLILQGLDRFRRSFDVRYRGHLGLGGSEEDTGGASQRAAKREEF